eukprot:5228943-Amphidinium_carterae.1
MGRKEKLALCTEIWRYDVWGSALAICIALCEVGEKVQIKVDYARRALVAKNHTATHILNFALRKVLGEKVDQKGSLVDEYKLRFDFSHSKPVEIEELKKACRRKRDS